MLIRVVNIHIDRECVEGGVRIYVGRPSLLGNDFKIGRDGSRTDVIRKHAEKLDKILLDQTHPVTIELHRLKQIAQQQPLELGCFCAPACCHADTLAERIKSL